MSERAAMKRRVRGLLQGSWLKPLCALVLAALPLLIIYALIFLLMRPSGTEEAARSVQLVWSPGDPKAMLLQLLMLFSDPYLLLEPLMNWLPILLILLAVQIFIAMPLMVSVSGYFLAFLRGKQPKVTSVFASFSGMYPRALGGMAYMLLWLCVWAVVSFALPTVLMFATPQVLALLEFELSMQIYIFIGVIVVCVIWYIVFFFAFISRVLAYSLTSAALAAQPRLQARRAVRLSRKLMRGCKWRLIGLFASFLPYFIPAIVAAVGLALLPALGNALGLAERLAMLRLILLGILGVNQLAWVYVAPYMAAAFHAFYIERKREALLDEEVTQEDFGTLPKAKDGLDNDE